MYVEQNETCYSDGVDWQTDRDEQGRYRNIARLFNHLLWGLGITSLLSGCIPILGTVHLGYFIWMAVAIFSDAGKLCTEHVLTSRGTFMKVVFWFNISILILACVAVCAVAIMARR